MSTQRSSSDDGLGAVLVGLAVAGLGLWALSKIFGSSDRPSSRSAVPEPAPLAPPSLAPVSSSGISSVYISSDDEEENDAPTICDYCHRPIVGEVRYYMGRPMDYTCWDSCDDQAD